MDAPRRPDGGERQQKGKGLRRPKRFHRGPGEAARWLAAVGRVDTARMAEAGDWREAADAVVPVAPSGHDVRERRGAPTR